MSALDDVQNFSGWDYAVFGIILGISGCIGLYHAFAGGRQKTTEEYLMAGRSLSAFPVALSVLASFFSASTLLGTPAEIYLRGTMYWMSVWGAMIAPLIGAYLFAPFFHRLHVVSVFEYLEARFQSKAVRLFGAFLFILKSVLGMGIVLFGPSVALEAVTGFPTWATIILIGIVCTFYTALGGMKAVIWTDVFQTGIMLAGMLAAIIQGCIEVGGINRVWEIAENGSRIEFFDFDPDPTVRHTFWTLVIGNIFVWLPPYTVDQQMIQRCASTKSLKQAVGVLLINAPGMFVIITLCSLAGVVMYAYYAELGCDPLKRGIITDPNQLMPRFVMDLFSFAPGVPGLFVASLFSGALSSISSMLNSLSAVTWEDYIKLTPWAKNATDLQATYVQKGLAIIYASLGIGMGFVFSNIGGTVLQMSIAFNGAVGAPLVGIFILGCFFPWTNSVGAIVGGVLGFAFPMWISIGAYVEKPPVTINLNTTIDGCPMANISATMEPDVTAIPDQPNPIEGIVHLYTLSYLWYTAAGILVTVFTGLVTSFATGRTRSSDIDSKYLISYVDKFWCCFPDKCCRPLRCGVVYDATEEEKKVLPVTASHHTSYTDIINAYEEATPYDNEGFEKNDADQITKL